MTDDLKIRQLKARQAAARAANSGAGGMSAERRAAMDEMNRKAEQAMRDPGFVRTVVAKGAQGATFGWADEMIGAMAPYVSDMSSEEATSRARALQADADFARPVTATAAQVGGNALALLPAIAAAPATLTGGSTLAGQGAAGIIGGGALGALQGAGDAPEGRRAEGALIGGGIGAALGGIAPVAMAGIGAATKPILDYIKKTDIAGITRALKISPEAARVIKAHIADDDPVAAMDALRRAGPEAMLADASPQASQLLDTTIAAGGPAMRIAREAVDQRAAAASGQMKTAMDRILGAPQGMRAAADDIATRTAAARKAAYDAAYGTPIDYSTGAPGEAILGVLDRIDPKIAQRAIDHANTLMRAQGQKNRQIMASVDAAGNVTYQEMPNVMQLDYIKRGLDVIAREADQLGRPTFDAGVAGGLARDLRNSVGAAVPRYRDALRLGGDKAKEDAALLLGRSFLRQNVTREEVASAMKGASVEARIAAKQGVREAFDEAMSNVKAVASDQNLDARQAVLAVKELSSDANREKATAILGKKAADELFEAFDKAATQLALRTAVARNSATAARTEGIAAMKAIVQDGLVNKLRHGEPLDAIRTVVQVMTKSTPADDRALEQRVFGEVARALTTVRGPQAQAAFRIVQKAIQGAPATQAEADQVARVLATIGGATAYQEGKNATALSPYDGLMQRYGGPQ